MADLEEYRRLGQQLVDKLRLDTHPVAVRLIVPDEPQPAGTVRPLEVFGAEIPACVAYTYARRMGASIYLTKDDIACKPIVVYFGLDTLPDPDDLFRALASHAGYKRHFAAEKASRADDLRLEPFAYKGLVVSPLPQTVVEPHLAMVFCSPAVLSHLILGATYDGDHIVSNFNGMEASCKEGIIRTHLTQRCQVVAPGMGDRMMAGVQDHEMIFAMPRGRFELVLDNLFRAGNRIGDPSPFRVPHAVPTIGPNRIFGRPVEPGVWPELRARFR